MHRVPWPHRHTCHREALSCGLCLCACRRPRHPLRTAARGLAHVAASRPWPSPAPGLGWPPFPWVRTALYSYPYHSACRRRPEFVVVPTRWPEVGSCVSLPQSALFRLHSTHTLLPELINALGEATVPEAQHLLSPSQPRRVGVAPPPGRSRRVTKGQRPCASAKLSEPVCLRNDKAVNEPDGAT